MRIKRLEILGFKSFVDKVSLDFQQGVSGIVGPNGCGKSNIVDAIRWVMGEQSAKNLRGRSMEDVIFGGSESRKPLGMAEVSIIFANEDGRAPAAMSEFAEIMVTRRLFRNGDSDYLLNKTPCRLLDITELFMDTGVGTRAYSIIEQGKIGMILNAKPEDRRFLIEEAAGVTKYKSRKKTALRKIEATKQNLLRLSDIVAEVRRQLGGLKRQAQKAQRFRELRDELKGIETRLAQERYAVLRAEESELLRKETEHGGIFERLAAELAQGELTYEEARLQQVTAEKTVAAGQEGLFQLSNAIQQAEGKIGFAGKELEGLEVQKERLGIEAAEVGERLGELDREEVTSQESDARLGEELIGAQRRQSEGEAALEALTTGERQLAGRLDESRNRLFGLLSELARLGNLHQDAERRLQSQAEREGRNRQEAIVLREQLEAARAQSAALETALHGFRGRKAELQQQREQTEELVRLLRRDLDGNEGALLVAREELNRHRSRLESLQELERNLEGYGRGVRGILREPALNSKFRGMLADALDVPGRLEVAVEAVLGERLQALLASGAGDVQSALDLLRRDGGRCSFLVPLPQGAAPLAVAGATPLAQELTVRDDAAAALGSLLRGVWLVASLDPFLGAGALPPGTLLVTPTGETLSWQGELRGGGSQDLAEGVLHKKREIKDLGAGVAARAQEVATLEARRQSLREQLQSAEAEVVELGAALHRKELKVVDHEKDLARAGQEAARLLDRVEVLSLEEDQLHEEREALLAQRSEADAGRAVKTEEKEREEASVQLLQEELQQRRAELDTVRERVTALKVEVAGLREREEGGKRHQERLLRLRQELQGRLALLHSRREEAGGEQERLVAERKRLQVEFELLVARRDEEKKRFDLLRETFDVGTRRIEEQEEYNRGRRSRLNDARQVQAELQVKLRELQLEAEHLRQTILDRYRLDLREVVAVQTEPLAVENAARRMQELRRAIDDVGEVNLTAVEEYEELETRYKFLSGQQEDLRQSLDSLQSAITKINRTTRKRFRETFDLVNAKFQEIFPRLFRGGKAELHLTDEEDLLETGIDIIAQPPGKKLQNVTLLSGGEKALTAVALIFSIFLIKPSPFCLLDEVDAPLDDANIGRFNEIVREMSAISQFVIITHNKRTMEIADTLYGVTMEEPGVSKLVSVHLNEY
ncbi:MAG: chromosome segregation protein SMC [Desulfuromonadales bacterium GWD2_61_12]|nr:MAG: chromosome segregation protein SMC [Desulfuromonadales bacterium GWD2_61_12]